MINVNDIWEGTKDDTARSEGGSQSFARFNRNLKRAEINLLKFLRGDLVPSNDFPVPYETQKIKDYLAPFIQTVKFVGNFKLPEDFYSYDYLERLGGYAGCDDDVVTSECNKTIEIWDKDVFNGRCSTYIKSLKPSYKKPIAVIIENGIIIEPKNIGSVQLTYIRYPVFGELKGRKNIQFNNIEYDPVTSINLEWGLWAMEPLIWFLTNKHATHTREKALKEFNIADKPRG